MDACVHACSSYVEPVLFLLFLPLLCWLETSLQCHRSIPSLAFGIYIVFYKRWRRIMRTPVPSPTQNPSCVSLGQSPPIRTRYVRWTDSRGSFARATFSYPWRPENYMTMVDDDGLSSDTFTYVHIYTRIADRRANILCNLERPPYQPFLQINST